MDYQSSRSFRPARAGAELRHGHFRRRQRFLQGMGIDRRGRRVSTDRRLSRSRREPVRHRRRLFRRARRTDPGRGDQGQAQPPAHFHQGDLPDGRRPERLWLLAPASFGSGRGLAQAAWRRDDRPPATARAGLQHAGRGDALHARSARARRQAPLHRLLEFLRLASHEVARDFGPLRLSPLRRAPGLLFAAQSRLRMGTDAARPRSGRRRGRLEPARLGQAHGKNPARTAGEARHPCAFHSGNRAALRREAPVRDRRRA